MKFGNNVSGSVVRLLRDRSLIKGKETQPTKRRWYKIFHYSVVDTVRDHFLTASFKRAMGFCNNINNNNLKPVETLQHRALAPVHGLELGGSTIAKTSPAEQCTYSW